MNEKEIEWANGLYVLQDGFVKLGDKILTSTKTEVEKT